MPAVRDGEWAREPLDAFIRAALDAAGLEPAPPVGRLAWLRRVTHDLLGLPPSPREIDAFLQDSRPDPEARAAVADRLLASSEYGVRWARHWLDVVRYADTDGFAIDGERPTLWRYRDYLVRALNEDRPFDRLIEEQIAGDLLEGAGVEGIVATGFFRLGPFEADNMVAEQRRQDFLTEVTNAVGSVFLGFTFGCARCHDHKYDPIPTRDYYRLQAFFTPFDRADRPAPFAPGELTPHLSEMRAQVLGESARRRQAHVDFRAELRGRLAKDRGKEPAVVTDADLDEALKQETPFTKEEKARVEQLRKSAAEFPEAARFAEVAVTITGTGGKPGSTRILLGGNVSAPGEVVEPGFPTAFSPGGARAASVSESADRPLDRRDLGRWLASAKNPVVPRVLANRLWHWHFGLGIVATPGDFGRNGAGASHPELLDHLARRLIDGGYRLKPFHRAIVLSRAYLTSTEHPDRARCEAVDPQNRLLWRSHFRRLEAEELRDTLLAASGRLNLEQGGPGFYEEIPEELGRSFPFFDWIPSPERERRRRSLYIFQRRNMVIPFLEAFDAPSASESCERRMASVTAPQALSLWNGKLAFVCASDLARRVLGEVGVDPRSAVMRTFRIVLGREPEESELTPGLALQAAALAEARGLLGPERGKLELLETEVRALAEVALALFNTNEVLYLP